MSPIPKTQRIWRRARAVHVRQSFHFQKIKGTLKYLPFTLKNDCQKENSKFEFFFIFCLGPQNGRAVNLLICSFAHFAQIK